MAVTDGLPIRLMFTFLVMGFCLYLIFRGYRRFILPGQLEHENGSVRQALFQKIEIIIWAAFSMLVVFEMLSYNLLIFGGLLIFIFVAFYGFWMNYFHGITVLFSGSIQEGDDIKVGKSQGRVLRFGLQGLHLIKTNGEEILLPYSKLNVPIRIEQKDTPDVLSMSVTILLKEVNQPHVRQRINDAVFSNPWIMVNRPVEILVEQHQVRIRYTALNQDMAELAKQKLVKDIGEKGFFTDSSI